jgi:hypothetical protein
MTIATATVMPAPIMKDVIIQPMKAIQIEDRAKIGEKVLTEGAT